MNRETAITFFTLCDNPVYLAQLDAYAEANDADGLKQYALTGLLLPTNVVVCYLLESAINSVNWQQIIDTFNEQRD
jgi:hypothetical protein